MKRIKNSSFFLLSLGLVSGVASAASISIDFNNTTNDSAPTWVLEGASETGGPLNTAYWNTTSTEKGEQDDLLDSSGATTAASIKWVSTNLWTTGELNGSNDRQLSHVYLDDGMVDDGGTGISITITDIPYANYRVYGLLSSGQNVEGDFTYVTLDFEVNGAWVLGSIINGDPNAGMIANAYGRVTGATPEGWVEILGDGVGNQTQTGNYWVFDSSGSSLSIVGEVRFGDARGSLSGLIIEEIQVVPEPSVSILAFLTASLGVFRRRR